MIVLIYRIVISDLWMVLCVQSCACCDCNSFYRELCETIRLKQKIPRRSQRNRTRSWKQVFRLAKPCNILKYRTSRKGKEPRDGWNLWRNFYVCTSCPHQYQRFLVHIGHNLTPMGQIKYITWTSSNLQFACAQSHFRCGGLFSSMSGERASLQVQLLRSGPLLSKIQHTEAPWHEECPSTDIMGKIQSKHNHQCEMLSRKC